MFAGQEGLARPAFCVRQKHGGDLSTGTTERPHASQPCKSGVLCCRGCPPSQMPPATAGASAHRREGSPISFTAPFCGQCHLWFLAGMSTLLSSPLSGVKPAVARDTAIWSTLSKRRS